MRSARVGELVADALRDRILSGTVASGDRLPPQEEILKEFRVGLPSVREAMRILEVEGLVTVHRGNVGGATVHLPNEGRVAYMMAMVLESQRIQQSEVATALLWLEPICAEMCAQRADRLATTVPRLEQSLENQRSAIGDKAAREFHVVIVEGCENAAISLAIGGLVQLWSAQEQTWTESAAPQGHFPGKSVQRQIVAAHERIAAAIGEGNEATVARLVKAHLQAAQGFHLSVDNHVYVASEPLRHLQRD
jgi:DNA-binding FadR family transcriptional regulator